MSIHILVSLEFLELEHYKIVDILKCLDWLVASLLENTYVRSNELKKSGATSFAVRNDIQVFYAQNLSIVYGQVSQTIVLNALERNDIYVLSILFNSEQYSIQF